MASILNNVAALRASRQLAITNLDLERTLAHLTTGRRINRAADDAAGLGISNKLQADVRIANQGRRNANDGVTYLQVADGVLEEVTNLLMRAAELVEQAKGATVSDTGRSYIDMEFQNIIGSIADLGTTATFNGQPIYGSTLTVSVGSFSPVVISVGTISNGANSALGLTQGTDNVLTLASATSMTSRITAALERVNTIRASIGATQNQLGAVSNSLGIQSENLTAAFSQIMDQDMAQAVLDLTKYQLLNQSGTSAMLQANQTMQSVLQLLK